VNKGKPIVIRFYPGENCKFGDRRGCVVEYQPDELNKVIFISVHSGVGGQAQRQHERAPGSGIFIGQRRSKGIKIKFGFFAQFKRQIVPYYWCFEIAFLIRHNRSRVCRSIYIIVQQI
jgi:hypothetical protein